MTEDKTDRKRKRIKTTIIALILFFIITAAAFAAAWLVNQKSREAMLNTPFHRMKVEKKKFPSVPEKIAKAFDVTELHKGSRVEWWYVNAHLVDEKMNKYTMMLTFLKPNRVFCILADIENQKTLPIVQEQRFELDPDTRTLHAKNFHISQPDPDYFCYDITSDHPRGKINLHLCSNKPPLIVGGDGRIKMGRGGRSYYYSLTNMNVSGTVSINDQNPIEVRGKAWLDRQWGNWRNEDFDQWQWFSIQIFGGPEIMVFNFNLNGRSIAPLCDIFWPDGKQEHNLHYRMKTLGNWYSEKTKVSWSSGWEIDIFDKDIKLTITPEIKDQEVTAALWEGGCTVKGTIGGKKIAGRAFYEERRKTWEDRRRTLKHQGVKF